MIVPLPAPAATSTGGTTATVPTAATTSPDVGAFAALLALQLPGVATPPPAPLPGGGLHGDDAPTEEPTDGADGGSPAAPTAGATPLATPLPAAGDAGEEGTLASTGSSEPVAPAPPLPDVPSADEAVVAPPAGGSAPTDVRTWVPTVVGGDVPVPSASDLPVPGTARPSSSPAGGTPPVPLPIPPAATPAVAGPAVDAPAPSAEPPSSEPPATGAAPVVEPATGAAPARPSAVTSTPLAGALARVLDAVEAAEQAPPPNRVVVELPELDGLRVQITVRGAEVALEAIGTPRPRDEGLLREAQQLLASQGYTTADGDRGRGDRDTAPRPDEVPAEDRPAPRRRRPADRGLVL